MTNSPPSITASLLTRSLVCALFLGTAAGHAAPREAGADQGGGKTYVPSVELQGKPGKKCSLVGIDVMIPVAQRPDRALFVDIRGILDRKSNKEGNIGLVYRHILGDVAVIGGYAYGDLRKTKQGNTFPQLTIGFDVLSRIIDARVNGYFPDQRERSTPGSTNPFGGAGITAFKSTEVALRGVDGEVGVHIPLGLPRVDVRLFGGGYHFSRPGGNVRVSGRRGRCEAMIHDVIKTGVRLTFGLEVSRDKSRGENLFGYIGLRIPLQSTCGRAKPLSELQKRVTETVVRDVDIVTVRMITLTGTLPLPPGSPNRTRFVTKDGEIIHITYTQAPEAPASPATTPQSTTTQSAAAPAPQAPVAQNQPAPPAQAPVNAPVAPPPPPGQGTAPPNAPAQAQPPQAQGQQPPAPQRGIQQVPPSAPPQAQQPPVPRPQPQGTTPVPQPQQGPWPLSGSAAQPSNRPPHVAAPSATQAPIAPPVQPTPGPRTAPLPSALQGQQEPPPPQAPQTQPHGSAIGQPFPQRPAASVQPQGTIAVPPAAPGQQAPVSQTQPATRPAQAPVAPSAQPPSSVPQTIPPPEHPVPTAATSPSTEHPEGRRGVRFNIGDTVVQQGVDDPEYRLYGRGFEADDDDIRYATGDIKNIIEKHSNPNQPMTHADIRHHLVNGTRDNGSYYKWYDHKNKPHRYRNNQVDILFSDPRMVPIFERFNIVD